MLPRHQKSLLVTGISAMLLSLSATVASSVDAKKPIIEPRAKQALTKMSSYLWTAKTFTFSARTMYDVVGASGIRVLNVVDLLYSKPYASYAGHILSAAYIGKRSINGVAAHQISIESADVDWQIWIKNGDAPVPLRLAVSYVTQAEKPGYITLLSDWQINAGLNRDRFTFNVPGGTMKAELLKRTAAKK